MTWPQIHGNFTLRCNTPTFIYLLAAALGITGSIILFTLQDITHQDVSSSVTSAID